MLDGANILSVVADAQFEIPRLAQVYDALEGRRADLEAYAAMAGELGARRVADVACGTGTFACLLASKGITVIGLDPAAASLEVARGKAGADLVEWIHGDASMLPRLGVDLVTMTGNAAQVFLTDEEWAAALEAVHAALRPGGRLVFESRDPQDRAWVTWNRENSYTRSIIPEVGAVEYWVEVTDLTETLVSFRSTYVFETDGATFESDSTLRFRSPEELTRDLMANGLVVTDVRGAPDRPGRELVLIAQSLG